MVIIYSRGTSESSSFAEYRLAMDAILNDASQFGSQAINAALMTAGATGVSVSSQPSDDGAALKTLFDAQIRNAAAEAATTQSNINDALTKAETLIAQGTRFQAIGKSGNIARSIILFSDGIYSGTNPFATFKSLKEKGFNIIIFTAKTDTATLSTLKMWASNEQAYSLGNANLADAEVAQIVYNSLKEFRYYLTTNTINIISPKGIMNYIEVPIDVSGTKIAVTSDRAIADTTFYVSTDFRIPSDKLKDYTPTVSSTDAQIYAIQGIQASTSASRLLSVNESPNTVFIGFTTTENAQLAFQRSTGVDNQAACPANCKTCNYPGTVCYACNDGYVLDIDTCKVQGSDGNTNYGEFMTLNNDGTTLFLSHLIVDYQGKQGVAISLGLIFILGWIAIVVIASKKLEWNENEPEQPQKPALEHAKDPNHQQGNNDNAEYAPQIPINSLVQPNAGQPEIVVNQGNEVQGGGNQEQQVNAQNPEGNNAQIPVQQEVHQGEEEEIEGNGPEEGAVQQQGDEGLDPEGIQIGITNVDESETKDNFQSNKSPNRLQIEDPEQPRSSIGENVSPSNKSHQGVQSPQYTKNNQLGISSPPDQFTSPQNRTITSPQGQSTSKNQIRLPSPSQNGEDDEEEDEYQYHQQQQHQPQPNEALDQEEEEEQIPADQEDGLQEPNANSQAKQSNDAALARDNNAAAKGGMNRIQEKDDEDEDYEYAVKRDKADEYD